MALFEKAKLTAMCVSEFKAKLVDVINQVRERYSHQPETTTSASKLSAVSPKQPCKPRLRFGQEALSEFIESKQLVDVT